MLQVQSGKVIGVLERNSKVLPFNPKFRRFRFVYFWFCPTYRNIRDQLWGWSTLTSVVISVVWNEMSLSFDKLLSPVPLFCILVTRTNAKRAVAWVVSVQPECTVSFIGHVKFPTFQTIEWKAPPNSTVRPTGWAIELHPFKPFLSTKPIHYTGK